MATSGSIDYTRTGAQVVEKAFSIIGVKAQGQDLSAEEMQDGLESLNLMLKSWQASGEHLWTKTQGVLFTQAGKTDYLLGPSGDHACLFDDFIGTTTTADVASGVAVIPVTSSAGMAVSDKVGVKLSDGTRQWSTILTVDSSTQITLNDNLTASATSGTSVFTYTDIIERPLRILNARRKKFGFDDEIRVKEMSNDDYNEQTIKSSQGTIVGFYYSPLLTNGRVYHWLTSDDVDNLFLFTFSRTIEDVDSQANNLDIPVEWLDCVTYNLAARLVDDYDVPEPKATNVVTKATIFKANLMDWDANQTSIQITPSSTWGS